MDEILRSNRRVGRVCDWTVIGVGAVSSVSMVLGGWLGVLIAEHQASWAVLAVPASLITAAVVAAIRIQTHAARQHEQLCAEYRASL